MGCGRSKIQVVTCVEQNMTRDANGQIEAYNEVSQAENEYSTPTLHAMRQISEHDQRKAIMETDEKDNGDISKKQSEITTNRTSTKDELEMSEHLKEQSKGWHTVTCDNLTATNDTLDDVERTITKSNINGDHKGKANPEESDIDKTQFQNALDEEDTSINKDEKRDPIEKTSSSESNKESKPVCEENLKNTSYNDTNKGLEERDRGNEKADLLEKVLKDTVIKNTSNKGKSDKKDQLIKNTTINGKRNKTDIGPKKVSNKSARPATSKINNGLKKSLKPRTQKANKHQYKGIDGYARKAPKSLKKSVEGLVKYMVSYSNEPRIVARGLFVWISENIRYDVEGFFGRAPKASCDALSVMQGGTSVCAGYANVMETLCRQAVIPVKIISGYAKGYGYSPDMSISLSDRTNHAWNAIQLEGKWHLLDCTWGSGHLDESNAFKKELNDFYFLTDPQHFINTHFPYMDGNLKDSMKCQLLENPISLEEFNNNVKYRPVAFELGLEAVSHPYAIIHMQDELEMIFKCTKSDDFVVLGSLMLNAGKRLIEQQNATFGVPNNNNGTYKLLVHPPKEGIYLLRVFCGQTSAFQYEGALDYLINCTRVKEHNFEYPMANIFTSMEKTILYKPLRGKLPENHLIFFIMFSPYLQHVSIGETTLQKEGDTFTALISTGTGGETLTVYGNRKGKYYQSWSLFQFKIVK